MKTAFEKLQASQQKLGEAIYASGEAAAGGDATEEPAAEGTDEDIVDAEVVEDEPEEPKK